MDKSVHKYNLRTGPFGLCSGYWDDNDQVFRQTTQREEIKCCINSCKPFVKECRELCKKSSTPSILKTCKNTCDDIQNLCEENCKLSGKLPSEDKLLKETQETPLDDAYVQPLVKGNEKISYIFSYIVYSFVLFVMLFGLYILFTL